MLESMSSRAFQGTLALEEDWLSRALGLEGAFGPARQQLQPHAMQPGQCRGQSNSLQVTAAATSAGGTGRGSDFGLL